jgi:NAD+ diphosphatase
MSKSDAVLNDRGFKFCPRCATALEWRDQGERPRLTCLASACGFVAWSNPIPAVGALIEHDGAMLLARGAGWPEGWFALITGYLEENEDPVAGIAREIKEEVGLTAVSTQVIGNYIFEKKNEVMLCYHVVCEGVVTLNHEIAEVKRYAPHELRPWPSSTGHAVADWMRARGLPVHYQERLGKR